MFYRKVTVEQAAKLSEADTFLFCLRTDPKATRRWRTQDKIQEFVCVLIHYHTFIHASIGNFIAHVCIYLLHHIVEINPKDVCN